MNIPRTSLVLSCSLTLSLAAAGASAGDPPGLAPFLIHDLGPGATKARPFVAHAGHLLLLFDAGVDNALVSTNGTTSDAPTVLTLPGEDLPDEPPALLGDTLVIEVDDPALGRELYVAGLDLSEPTLIADVAPGPGNGSNLNSGYAVFGDKLFYRGEDATSGDEPWVTDGTAAGTYLLKDIDDSADGADGMPGQSGQGFPYVHDGLLYFLGETPAEGRELWATDGTSAGTHLVADLLPGPTGSFPRDMTLLGGVPYFLADDGAGGSTLYRTDGTSSGTVPLVSIPAVANLLVEHAGELYFSGFDGTHGTEVWVTDGTQAGTHVLDLMPGIAQTNPQTLLSTEMGLVFWSNLPPDNTLYVTDGTLAGTSALPATDATDPVVDGEGTLFFLADGSAGPRTIHAASSALGVADLGHAADELLATDMGVFWSTDSTYGSATSFTRYGRGSDDSTGGVPAVSLTGDATPGGILELDVTGNTPGELVALFTGIQSSAIPLGLGGQATLLVNPFTVRVLGALPGSGTLSLSAAIPTTFTAGTVLAQAAVVDAAAPSGLGFALTDAVQMTIE